MLPPMSAGSLVPVGGTRLWVETRGRGRRVVLLADVGFDGRVWKRVADRLAAEVMVSTVDPRGWGRSEPGADAEAGSLVDDVVGLAVGLPSRDGLVLAAQGDVGQAALLAGARAPERIAAVLAIQPAVRGAEPPPDFDMADAGAVADEHFGAVVDALVAAQASEGSRDAAHAALLSAVLPASLACRPEGDLVAAILRDNLDSYLAMRGPGYPGAGGDSLSARLEDVACPVTVAIARDATPLQRWAQRMVLESVPDARAATLAVDSGRELALAPLIDPDGLATLLGQLVTRAS
jgi:pimeloyl-ACP methyl ester carboxylesterase